MDRKPKRIRTELILFVLLFFSGSYFYYSIDYDNTSSRLYLVSAIVDFGILNIDPYESMTADKSFNDGHFYSNKAIGGPLMAVPIYWLQRQVEPWRNQPPLTPFMRYIIRVFTTTIPFAFLGIVLFRLSRHWGAGKKSALLMVLSYSLGSIAIIHSNMFSGHEMAAAFSFFSFAALFKLREEPNSSSNSPSDSGSLNLSEPENSLRHAKHKLTSKFLLAGSAGLSSGIGALCDYTAIWIAVALTCYALISRIALRYKVIYIGSGVLCAVLLAAYNWWCFGSPVSFSYNHLVLQEFAEPGKEGVMGITLPKLGPLISILFSPARGLFAIMPVFLFSVLGLWKMFRHHSLRREACLVFVIVVGYVMINAGFYGWHGGWAYGPRYLIPMLPFLAIPMIFAPREPLVFGLALFFSAIQVTFVAVSVPHTPIAIRNPLAELVIPLMFEGYLAESWPMWLGLSNFMAMLLYFIVCAFLICFVWRLAKRDAREEIGDQMMSNVRGVRKRLIIRDWRISLPVVGWLLVISFMLNFLHTAPSQPVVHYRERLLYHLQVKDVIHQHIGTLAGEFESNLSQTLKGNE